MKYPLVFLFILSNLIFISGCQAKKETSPIKNSSHEEILSATTSDSTTSSSDEIAPQTSGQGDYATKEDIIKEETQYINGEEYILYTLKGNKAVALPKEQSIEEAKIDMSVLPIIGTPQEEVENK